MTLDYTGSDSIIKLRPCHDICISQLDDQFVQKEPILPNLVTPAPNPSLFDLACNKSITTRERSIMTKIIVANDM